MAQGKDFYGQEVTTIINEACRDFGVSQEELDIEVLETGSAGIFGLCRKKAHIRVQLKGPSSGSGNRKGKSTSPAASGRKAGERQKSAERSVQEQEEKKGKSAIPAGGEKTSAEKSKQVRSDKAEQSSVSVNKQARRNNKKSSAGTVEPPTEEVLDLVKIDICRLLDLMGYPSEVSLKVEASALRCHINGTHEDALVGTDGRTLDSMQYLLRKMMSSCLPERMMLSLDAGDFRQRRAEELKTRALELAEQVKESGKTQAIPALNPAERREVHMVLQEDKAIRSRSVGDGLFKKILIYKPGKGNKSSARKRRGRQSGRSTEN